MSLTNVEKIRLELGLNSFEEEGYSFFTDDELSYFLEKNDNSIRRASIDVAKSLLFILSQYVHSKTGIELEIWGNEWMKGYMETLKMYISDPNYSIATTGAMPYVGGVSKSDARDNIENTDNIVSEIESNIPTDYSGYPFKDDPFDDTYIPSSNNDPFDI